MQCISNPPVVHVNENGASIQVVRILTKQAECRAFKKVDVAVARVTVVPEVPERRRGNNALEDSALATALASFSLPSFAVRQGCARGMLEDFADTLTRLGAAFDVLDGTDTLPDFLAL